MAKKEIDDTTIQLIIDKIDTNMDITYNFKKDMHDKVDKALEIIEKSNNEVKLFVKDEINEIRKEIDSMKIANTQIAKNKFEIIGIKKNINDLAEKTRLDKEEIETAFNNHCIHHEELIEKKISDTIKTFKASIFTKIIAVGSTALSLFLIGLTTGILQKIWNFLKGLFV